MKHLNASIALLLAVIASITFAGCSSKPYDELRMVKTAADEARNKEAYEYAPNDWDRGRMDWQMANALIQMGRYSEARDVLVTAVGDFNQARDEASRRVESLKVEIDSLQSVLKDGIEALRKAGDNPGTKAALRKQVDSALPFIEEKIAIMKTALEDKQYLSARMYGKQALQRVNDLEQELGISQH